VVRHGLTLLLVSGCVDHSVLLLEPDMTADGDFARRCASAAVVLCESFDEPIPLRSMGEDGIVASTSTPLIDTGMHASGRGSLRFTVPSESDQFAAGKYFTNFTDDLSVQFGEGEQFFVQWRQRFSPEWLTRPMVSTGVHSIVRLTAGDEPGVARDWCGYIDLVVSDVEHRNVPQMTHSCGFKDGGFEALERVVDGVSWIDVQPGGPTACAHDGSTPTCARYEPNEWMTFQLHVAVGTWYANDRVYRRDSVLELWVAREGEPSVLAIRLDDLDLANEIPPTPRYGKIWFMPEFTYSDPTEAHPDKLTWYDELIVSRERISDPLASPP
jgi:hypothetical protein